MNIEERLAALIAANVVENPEKNFDLPNLAYKSREISYLLDQFSRAPSKPVYEGVMDLLGATKNFRHATEPKGMFARLRTLSKTDEELKKIFSDLYQAFITADQLKSTLNEKDQTILAKAMAYCKESVFERMEAVSPEDKLQSFWRESALKQILGQE